MSDRKRAAAELRDRQAFLQAILDTVADAVVAIDNRGIILSVNSSTERMFGYTSGEMIGQSVNVLMPSPYREEHDGYLAKYLKTGEKRVIDITREIEARRKDGSVFPTELSVSEIANQKIFVGVHRDLTARRRLERDVVEAASSEQRRIGRDLHDSVAQELTALNLLAKDLSEMIRTDPDNASNLVGRMGHGLQRSQQRVAVCPAWIAPRLG